MWQTDNLRVFLNVGGIRQNVLWKTIEKLPTSRLGNIRFAKTLEQIHLLCDGIDFKENELFFDRDPNTFHSVINFYRTGKFHYNNQICILSFHDDLLYWGLDVDLLEQCCRMKYHQRMVILLEEIKKREVVDKKNNESFGSFCPVFRQKLWDVMDNPHSSRTARVSLLYLISFAHFLSLFLFGPILSRSNIFYVLFVTFFFIKRLYQSSLYSSASSHL
jgi:hypothetical protein